MDEAQKPLLLHVLRNDALGGLEQSTLEVARYFAARDVRQHLLIMSPLDAGISERFAEAGIDVTSIPFSKSGAIAFVAAYRQLVKRLRPDIQLVSGAFGLHALLAMLGRIAGIRHCWTYLIMGPASHGLPWLVQTVMGQMARLFARGEIAVSAYLRTTFHHELFLPLRRVHVVSRWRPIRKIADLAQQARLLKAPGHPIVSTAGRLDWMKDFPGMVEGFARFAEMVPTARFRIVGEGPMRTELEAQVARLGISDKVDFLGFRKDVPSILGGSDIFLFSTSPTEGIGNVLVEAMAAGTPVVCTDIGPCAEVLGHGEAGILVPPRSPDRMAQAMADLWHDPARRQALSRRAYEFAHARYSMEQCGAQLYELIIAGCARDSLRNRSGSTITERARQLSMLLVGAVSLLGMLFD
jgi:glycosyltransferase involved in cell wall biosynthesis